MILHIRLSCIELELFGLINLLTVFTEKSVQASVDAINDKSKKISVTDRILIAFMYSECILSLFR